MEWLQRIYIFVLNPFCGISNKINYNIRKSLIYVTCFLLYSTCYIWYSIIGMGTPLTLLSRMLQSIALIIILIFLSLDKPLKAVKWKNSIIIIWFALGMLIFVLGFFTEQNTGYWMTGPVIALGLPCFYMIYGKKEKYELLFDAICKAAIICSIVYFIVCIFGEYFNDNTWDATGRYNGLTIDANKIGELCLSSFCCIMYLLLIVKEKSIWNKLAIIALGIVIGQTYLTQSRTTIMAMIFVAGFYTIIVVKDSISKKTVKNIIDRFLPIIIAVFIAVICVSVINNVHEKHIEEARSSVSTNVAVDEVLNSDNTTLETTQQSVAEAETHEYRDMIPEKGTDLNSFSSGRLFIWKTYSEGFNFIGNDADAETPISPLIKQRTAHNSLVEITYRSGYITGGVYLILVLITGIYLLRVMLRKNEKNTNGDYFFSIASIGYIIFTSLMSSFNPLTAIIFLLYAIAFPVLLEKRE